MPNSIGDVVWDRPKIGEVAWDGPAPKPKPEVTGADQAFDVAVGRGFDRLASGLRAAVPDWIRTPLDKLDALAGVQSPPIDPQTLANNEAEYAKVSQAFPKTTFAGEMVPSLAARNPAGLALLGGLEIGTPAERATRAALNYGAGKAGEWVGGKIADKFASNAADNAAQLAASKVQNTARDATIKEAQAAGYALPPTMVNPSPLNRLAEGLSGKIQTAQALALKNEAVTQQLAKKALLLPQDAPLTKESIGAVRSAAGQVYQAVKGFGPVTADDELRGAMGNVLGGYRELVNEFPSQKNPAIESLMADLNKDTFSSSNIVELVKRLRHDGFKNLTNMDPEKVALGRVQIGAQNALEDLLDRNLAQTGNQGAIDAFRNARQLIAKTYTVEKALEDSTGKIVAGKIGKEFSKGRPLSGELATIGKMAQAFPKAVQNVNTSMPGLSPLDAAFGAGTAVATANPLMAAIPLARPAVRAGLLSGPYQRAFVQPPSYAPGLADQLMAKAGDNPEMMKRLGGLLGVSALRAYQ